MANEANIWYFEDINLYNVFCPHLSKEMADNHTFSNVKRGEFIYFPDEQSSHVYLITEGRVKIGSYSDDGKEIIKSVLSKGEIFGELAIIGEDKRTDFAQAMDKVTLCPLTLEDMECLMKENRTFSIKMTKLIGLRLRRAERRIESLVFKDARTRVIEYLRDLVDTKGRKVGYEYVVDQFFKHQDIANMTATSRQTVTTILNELKDKNILTFDRKRLLIRDLEKLI